MSEVPDNDDASTAVDGTLPEKLRDLDEDTSLAELTQAYKNSLRADKAADEAKFHGLLTRLMVSKLVWLKCSRHHADAKTPSDRAKTMGDYLRYGKDRLGLKTAQWKKYLRLSAFIEDISAKTREMQAEQCKQGATITFPSLNTLNTDWFPADPEGREESKIAREQVRELREATANMKEKTLRDEVMQAHDAKIVAVKELESERQARWDSDTRQNQALAERDAMIAEQASTIAGLRVRLAALTELPDDEPEPPPGGPGGGPVTPDPPEPEPEPESEPEPELTGNVVSLGQAISWAEMSVSDMIALYRRVLTPKDLPDLTDETMDAEEDEYGISRRGAALKDKTQNRAARRLRLLCVRICAAKGETAQAAQKLSQQSRKWFAERLSPAA